MPSTRRFSQLRDEARREPVRARRIDAAKTRALDQVAASCVPLEDKAPPSLLGSVRYESEEDLLAPIDEPWAADR
jgi:hypothetical protein